MGRQDRKLSLAQHNHCVMWPGPPAASLMLFVTQQGSQGDFTVWGRGFRDIVTSLERNIS